MPLLAYRATGSGVRQSAAAFLRATNYAPCHAEAHCISMKDPLPAHIRPWRAQRDRPNVLICDERAFAPLRACVLGSTPWRPRHLRRLRRLRSRLPRRQLGRFSYRLRLLCELRLLDDCLSHDGLSDCPPPLIMARNGLYLVREASTPVPRVWPTASSPDVDHRCVVQDGGPRGGEGTWRYFPTCRGLSEAKRLLLMKPIWPDPGPTGSRPHQRGQTAADRSRR